MTHGPTSSRRRIALLCACALGVSCQGAIDTDKPGAPGSQTPGAGDRPGSSPADPRNPGTTPLPGTPAAPPPTAACKANADPGPTELHKLTTVQYRNTVHDLLAASGVAMVADEIKDQLAAVPADVDALFAGLANDISPDHVSAFYRVATAAAAGATGQPARLTAIAGACAATAPLSATCFDTFLNGFGKRAFRRPLTMDELTSLRALNDGKLAPADVISSAMTTMMLAPRFLNQFENEGAPIDAREDYLQLSPWEIASRLSYTFWQTMPDDALFAAAADGSVATEAGFQKQLERVYADPRSKDTVWQFWSQWLRLDGAFLGFATDRPAFKNLVAGENINAAGHDHYRDMVQEVRDLTEYIGFGKRGALSELLTTDVSVTRSADIAHLYKVAPWDGKSDYPHFTDGSRVGLLTRSAMLVVGEEQTNPFHRGATIRKRLLCDPVPQPDPNSLPPGSLDAPPNNPNMTTRQRYAAKMMDQCLACHSMFNDIGYVLESYDPLGRYRTTEKVFDAKGMITGELPIDATAVPRIDLADMRPVTGAIELTRRVVDSKKLEPCFSRQFLTYALRRATVDGSGDSCSVDDMVAQLTKPGVGLGDVYRRVALQASFRRRKVGTP